MIDDEKIIDLFFERSEQGIRELDNKYGAVCHNLSYNIVNNRQDAEECVNDAYLAVLLMPGGVIELILAEHLPRSTGQE